jgi:hypothetical protein
MTADLKAAAEDLEGGVTSRIARGAARLHAPLALFVVTALDALCCYLVLVASLYVQPDDSGMQVASLHTAVEAGCFWTSAACRCVTLLVSAVSAASCRHEQQQKSRQTWLVALGASLALLACRFAFSPLAGIVANTTLALLSNVAFGVLVARRLLLKVQRDCQQAIHESSKDYVEIIRGTAPSCIHSSC